MLGIPAGTFTGKYPEYLKFVHPDDRAAARRIFTECVKGLKPDYRAEERVIWPDGSVHWLETHGRGNYGADGRCVRMAGVVRDITARRQQEASLAASEARFSTAFQSAPTPLAVSRHSDGVFVNVNQAFERASGWSAIEVIGHTPDELKIWIDPVERDALLAKLARDGSVREMRVHLRRKDGSTRVCDITTEVIVIGEEPCTIAQTRDLTELLHTRQEQQTSERKYRAVFDTSPEAMSIARARDGAMLEVNDAWLQTSGRTREEVIGRSALEFGLYADPSEREAIIARLAAERHVSNVPLHIAKPDGTVIEVSGSGALFDFDGESCVAWVGRDVTEQRRMEASLTESERRFRTLFDSALDGIVIASPTGILLDVNPTCCWATGYLRDELVGKSFRMLFEREDLTRHPPRPEDVFTLGSLRGERQLRRKDGSLITAEIVAGPLPDGNIQAMVRDISKRKRAEEDVRRFRLALDNSADMILLVDRAAMRFIDANSTACRLLGYTREELVEMRLEDLLPMSRAELEAAYDRQIADPSVPAGLTSYYRCKDGSHLAFESKRQVLRSGDNWLISIVSRDIRERIAAEHALRESENLKSAVLESSLDSIITMDDQGKILDFNSAAETVFGLARGQALGKAVADLIIPPRLREAHERGLAHYRATGEGAVLGKRIEIEAMRADGTEFPVELAITPIKSGSTTLFTAFIRDISVRKEAEEKIKRLSRVHAMLSAVNSAIVRIGDRVELFRETCRIAVSEGGFVVARVIELDQNGKASVAAGTDSIPRAFQEVLDDFNRDPENAQGLLALALRDGKSIVCNDVASDPRVYHRAALAKEGIYAIALLPMIVEKRVAGVIILRAREAGMFDEQETKLLNELTGDISFALQHIEKSEKVNYLALYDQLTGLANRTLFLERLNQTIQATAQSGGKFAIVLADIERLRTVNESLGRHTGDALLNQVAERVSRAAGRTGVGRIAADQFAMVLATV
ncbi:MAG: PAS domain S-box protein, partial [Candidatus Binataceae bacterium]